MGFRRDSDEILLGKICGQFLPSFRENSRDEFLGIRKLVYVFL